MLPPLTVLALDVGGTSVKSGLVKNGALLGTVRKTPLPSQAPAPELLQAFKNVIAAYPEAEALAFAFPGPFDYDTGVCRVQGLEKFGSLYGKNLGEALAGGRPVRFRNDAEAAIVGEASAGRVLGITLGTGLGSAFLIDHTPVTEGPGVPPNGWLYGKPAHGTTADEVFSIRGLKRRAGADPADIQDPRVWEEFGTDLGHFLKPYADQFRAETVLVLGGIAAAWPHFGQALNEIIQGKAKPGRLGSAAPLLGAARLF